MPDHTRAKLRELAELLQQLLPLVEERIHSFYSPPYTIGHVVARWPKIVESDHAEPQKLVDQIDETLDALRAAGLQIPYEWATAALLGEHTTADPEAFERQESDHPKRESIYLGKTFIGAKKTVRMMRDQVMQKLYDLDNEPEKLAILKEEPPPCPEGITPKLHSTFWEAASAEWFSISDLLLRWPQFSLHPAIGFMRQHSGRNPHGNTV